MEKSELNNDKVDRYFKGEYSEDDAVYVNEVFCEKDKEDELRNLLFDQYKVLMSEDENDKKNLDHILNKIHYNINTKIPLKKERRTVGLLCWSYRIAATIILPISLFWGIKGYLNNRTGKETWVEINAPAGTRCQFSLPDGTSGWLNSNSSIKYNGNFNSDRQVILKGEAFFDVTKDKLRPFRVNTNEIVVKVLGTRFDISSFDEEKSIEVVLVEGKIELNDREKKNSLIMNPNDLVIYNKTFKNFSKEVVESQKYLSWKEGKLVFRNDPMDIIVRKLERCYNIDIEVKGKASEDLRLRATFSDESLEDVLYFLKRSLHIDYNIESSKEAPDGSYIRKKVIITLSNK